MVKIQKLDMISAAENSGSLVRLLQDSVKNGASVSFLNPLSDSAAESYWREVFSEINSAQIIVWAAIVFAGNGATAARNNPLFQSFHGL